MGQIHEPLNVIVTGVGGQGNVLASQVLAAAAVEAGYRVSIGETFGASQRGGSVMSHVRISRDKTYGPLIPRGHAGLVVGFEPLETLRILMSYGNADTVVVMNDRPNYPIGCLLGEDKYPDPQRIIEAVNRLVSSNYVLSATELAKEAGNPMAANMVLTGALSGCGVLPFDRSYFKETMDIMFTGEIKEINTKAFNSGFEAVKNY
ncbi:MAG: indolepyruvate oxidoreductase subunit beta [Desulfocucumaceae bacterium]